MKRFLLIGLALLASMCSSDKDDNRAATPTEAKIMSFNIRGIMSEDIGDRNWNARKEPIIQMIRAEKPDVIGFQEPKWQQVAYLMQELSEYDQVKRNVNNWTSTESTGAFNMIMYRKDKYSLVEWNAYWLSSSPESTSYPWNATDLQRRVCVWVHLKELATQRDLYVFTTHLPYQTEPEDDEARLKCVLLNIERMKAIAGEKQPVFITGDMNSSYAEIDTRRSCLKPYYDWMSSARDEISETEPHYSFNNFGESTPRATWNIDHIFYRNAKVTSFRTVIEGYGVPYLSDHYPIISTLKF